jgi:hypothetical protein
MLNGNKFVNDDNLKKVTLLLNNQFMSDKIGLDSSYDLYKLPINIEPVTIIRINRFFDEYNDKFLENYLSDYNIDKIYHSKFLDDNISRSRKIYNVIKNVSTPFKDIDFEPYKVIDQENTE